ncbi:hypothetical protein M758_7G163900 [Ceratodon purpureus]|uniref:Secreted protein n=1 Tax=Ceratodon purpureus TaxID=3225 RepID=A0A8T0H724_CERPU|nr:hypothetical protein KC19_7G116200 [Ceratodon purpureus]KAG0611777.1 hypothetical protein M758_7G163900 [Ceratodon purpureus]
MGIRNWLSHVILFCTLVHHQLGSSVRYTTGWISLIHCRNSNLPTKSSQFLAHSYSRTFICYCTGCIKVLSSFGLWNS